MPDDRLYRRTTVLRRVPRVNELNCYQCVVDSVVKKEDNATY